MIHASLFSGIGGAEIAASWLGWQNLFHCEIQEFQRKVLAYWFPESISYEDITKTDFRQWRGRVDILTGGFPCQPFSIAGKRFGAKDDRYLWPHMLRAIREIQPTWVVCENVAGILSMVQPGKEVNMGGKASLFEENYRTREEQLYTIEGICQGLEQAGYSVQPIVIPACAVGAPHRRDRVWIVANRTDAGTEDLRKRKVDTDEPRAHADTERCRGYKMVKEVQHKLTDGARIDCNGAFGDVADPSGGGLQYGLGQGERKSQQRLSFETPHFQTGWEGFPTQPPICSRDDGLSIRMANLTISFAKWRRKSIEALGNAWVPQVAYEIFKAIEKTEANDTTNNKG